jgi:hypothetical protein
MTSTNRTGQASPGHVFAGSRSWADLDAWYERGGDPLVVNARGDTIGDIIAKQISIMAFDTSTIRHSKTGISLKTHTYADVMTASLGPALSCVYEAYRSWIRHGGHPWRRTDWGDWSKASFFAISWHGVFNIMREDPASTPVERVCGDAHAVIMNGENGLRSCAPWTKDIMQDSKAIAMAMAAIPVLASIDPMLMSQWMQRIDTDTQERNMTTQNETGHTTSFTEPSVREEDMLSAPISYPTPKASR